MKQAITLIALVAVLALMSTGCSELNNPMGPHEISTISIPVDITGDEDSRLQPAAPTRLEATKVGSTVELSWTHSSKDVSNQSTMPAQWFRIYLAQGDGRYEMIRATQSHVFTDHIGTSWSKLSYRVTAMNSAGVESAFSHPAKLFRETDSKQNIDAYELNP